MNVSGHSPRFNLHQQALAANAARKAREKADAKVRAGQEKRARAEQVVRQKAEAKKQHLQLEARALAPPPQLATPTEKGTAFLLAAQRSPLLTGPQAIALCAALVRHDHAEAQFHWLKLGHGLGLSRYGLEVLIHKGVYEPGYENSYVNWLRSFDVTDAAAALREVTDTLRNILLGGDLARLPFGQPGEHSIIQVLKPLRRGEDLRSRGLAFVQSYCVTPAQVDVVLQEAPSPNEWPDDLFAAPMGRLLASIERNAVQYAHFEEVGNARARKADSLVSSLRTYLHNHSEARALCKTLQVMGRDRLAGANCLELGYGMYLAPCGVVMRSEKETFPIIDDDRTTAWKTVVARLIRYTRARRLDALPVEYIYARSLEKPLIDIRSVSRSALTETIMNGVSAATHAVWRHFQGVPDADKIVCDTSFDRQFRIKIGRAEAARLSPPSSLGLS